MEHIKRIEEFKVGTYLQHNKLDEIGSLNAILKKSIREQERWAEIIKSDFEDLPVLNKEKNGFMVDVRLDGFHNYKQNNHLPCVYFRVGDGEYDFLPMIIADIPYVPYSFEQTITDSELCWVGNWVKRNKEKLLDYANEKIGSGEMFSYLKENAQTQNTLLEGKAKIDKRTTGLTRIIWIGPYDKTQHYLRIKIQTPKTSNNSREWASMSIPDLKVTPQQTDLKPKEEKNIGIFATINQKPLDDFANSKIDFQELVSKIVKLDKKGNPVKRNTK